LRGSGTTFAEQFFIIKAQCVLANETGTPLVTSVVPRISDSARSLHDVGAVLPSLTHETLKELGVVSVGHRVKLLEAIAALRGNTGVAGLSNDLKSRPAALSVSPENRAERRQVTVVFSDLVGSTALSARMDPEDLREIITAYQKCVAETVQRFGGFVAKYMGDGVLVYFGYPQAHEDDAERAVRAGLALVSPSPNPAQPNRNINQHE
jgi:hypothetical protein